MKYLLILFSIAFIYLSYFFEDEETNIKVQDINSYKKYTDHNFLKKISDTNKKKYEEKLIKLSAQNEMIPEKFEILANSMNRFDKDRVYSDIFNDLEQSNAHYTIVNYLIDPKSTVSSLGEKQAYTRMFGIKYLSYLAKKGESHYLEEALIGLYKNIENDNALLEYKGVNFDIEDLLRELTKYTEIENLENYLNNIGFDLSYVRSNNVLRESFVHGLYSGLRTKLNHKDTVSMIDKVINITKKG